MRLVPPALVLILLAPQAPAAEPVGRLFYTPDQRAALDSARSKRARTGDKAEEAPPPAPTAEVVTYGGMVRRSDGKTTVWLNNRAVTEKESADARIVGRIQRDGTVMLQSAQTGRNVPLRVGQRADLLSGRVDEGYRRLAPKPEDKDVAGPRSAPEPAAATEAEQRRKEERERQENLDDAVRAMRDAAQAKPAAAPPQQPGGPVPVFPAPMQPAAPGTAQAPAQSVPDNFRTESPMSVHCPPRREPRAARERGQAMLLTVLLVGVSVSAVVYNFATPARQSLERDRITAAALAQAKAALIGYAVGIRVDTAGSPRIGDLPCPDITNTGVAGGACSNAGGTTIGRLPWRTLGLPDLRDGSGERLWYAVSENFKNNPAVGTLNSDSRGAITVRDRNGNVVNDGTDVGAYTRSGAVAVILAPGAIITRLGAGAPQQRDPGVPATLLDPVNYLDIANVGGNEDNANFVDGSANGLINGPLLDASRNAIVNDQLIVIRYDDIMPLMERRVAGEALRCLTSYAGANNGRYPWAAPFGAGYVDDAGQRFGRFPDAPFGETVLGDIPLSQPALVPSVQADCTASPALCMGNAWPASPACNFAVGTWWQNWKEQVFYGVALSYAPSISLDGSSHPTGINAGGPCPPCLTVNPPSAAADKRVVVIVAGKPLANPPLTSAAVPGEQRVTAAQKQDVSNYLEGENITAPADTYSRIPRTSTFNDAVSFR